MRRICADSGFLIALYEKGRDPEHHELAESCFEELFESVPNRLVVPWPALYETVSTRMVRRAASVRKIDIHWKTLRLRDQLDFVDDSPFRDIALDECLSETAKPPGTYRPLSLADRVIRGLLSDRNLHIDVLLTFNVGDFSDVCRKFRREIVP